MSNSPATTAARAAALEQVAADTYEDCRRAVAAYAREQRQGATDERLQALAEAAQGFRSVSVRTRSQARALRRQLGGGVN